MNKALHLCRYYPGKDDVCGDDWYWEAQATSGEWQFQKTYIKLNDVGAALPAPPRRLCLRAGGRVAWQRSAGSLVGDCGHTGWCACGYVQERGVACRQGERRAQSVAQRPEDLRRAGRRVPHHAGVARRDLYVQELPRWQVGQVSAGCDAVCLVRAPRAPHCRLPHTGCWRWHAVGWWQRARVEWRSWLRAGLMI